MNGNLKTASKMKNRYFIIACAAAVIATGCAKEAMDNASLSSKTVLSVTIADGSKTTLGELSEGSRPIYWSDGDVMCCNGVSSVALSNVPEKATAAEFTFDAVLERPYNLLYPASLYKDATTLTLPAVCGNIPLGGQNGSISALTGIIKLTVKGGDHQDKISYVKVSSAAAQLSGDFCIDYAAGTLDAISNNEADKSVKAVIGKALAKDETVELFIPVPVGEYGFTVRIVDVMGHYMEKSTTAPKNIVAGQINAFPELVFAPTGTQFDIEINSAEKLVKFAQDYNAGAFEENPIVGITDDIVFDDATNAEFLATGGIGVQANADLGTSDNYFNGVIHGNNHSIKNWKNYSVDESGVINTSAPLFAFTGSAGYIQDLVLDSTCDLAFPKGNAGSLVGRHKGLLKNCTNNADVTLLMQAGATYFGGLVGRVYGGTIDGCIMNGKLLNPTEVGSTKVYAVGGITGTLEDGGVIRNCRMNANLQWGMRTKGDGPSLNNGQLFLGLIAGHVINGTVEGCTAIPQSGTSATDIRGMVGKANLGGIVGGNDELGTVSNCEFNGEMYVRSKGPSGEGFDTDDFYCHVGGIVGRNAGTITNCRYSGGKVTNNSAQYKQTIGGICGENSGSITACENYSSIIGPSQYNSTVHMYEGGLVGYTTTALSDLTNNGEVTLSTSSTTYGSAKGVARYIGGCVGYVNTDITLSNLTNKGEITTTQTTKLNGAGYIIGGVVGAVESAAVISNCVNEGVLYNNVFNNTYSPMLNSNVLGGIVGVISAPEGSKATIANCINSVEYSVRRGVSGGIVGWSVGATISECEVTGNAGKTEDGGSNENIPSTLGGVVGKAEDTGITDCTVTATLRTKGATARATYGGIVGSLDPTSFVDRCKFIGKMIGNGTSSAGDDIYGSIAGASVAGAYIHNCGAKGSIDFAGDGKKIVVFSEDDFCGDNNYEDTGKTNYIIK